MINAQNLNRTVSGTNYKYIICPICQLEIQRTKAGIHSHLGKHIRQGNITIEERAQILKEVLFRGRSKF